MSKLPFDMIPAAPRSDIIGLRTVILKLEKHLKSTNEKIGNFRKLIRTEANIKSRDIYLKKVCDMVKEQHRIQSILQNYRSKLKKQESLKRLKFVPKQTPQQTQNSKLIELFHNYEQKETGLDTQNGSVSEPSKRKMSAKKEIVHVKGQRSVRQIRTSNDGDMISLKDHVRKRITKKAQKLVVPQIVKVEHAEPTDDIPILEEANLESEELTESEQAEHIFKIEVAEETEYVNETEHMVEEKTEISDNVSMSNTILINNLSDAMQCLKALQEYAMLNENYRAIGLLSDTEKAFANPADDTDFEL